jgi:hypothetical protein
MIGPTDLLHPSPAAHFTYIAHLKLISKEDIKRLHILRTVELIPYASQTVISTIYAVMLKNII